MIFEKLYNKALDDFRRDKNGMRKIAGIKEGRQITETAALVTVAGAMMNIDEFVTKN